MPLPGYNNGDGNDTFSFTNPDGSVGTRFDLWGRPRQGLGSTGPVVAVGAGAGTGATVTAHTGTDCHGNIQITSGTSTAAGTLCTITFAHPFVGTNPPVVQLEAKDAGASALYYAACTNTVLTVKLVNAPTASTAYSFDYFVVSGA